MYTASTVRVAVSSFAVSLAACAGLAFAAPPGEVGPTLAFDGDKSTLIWDGIAGADAYNVYRGTDRQLGDLDCYDFRTALTSSSDPDVPGALSTYVVAAWNADGEGPLGSSTAGLPRSSRVACSDDDLDGVRDDQDNCAGLANPSQADQDANGLGDPCDPRTYTFEDDLLGVRPAGVTQLGPPEAGFVVQDYSGDQGVAYDGGVTGVEDAFDGVGQERVYQDLDVYVDTVDLVGEFLTVALWPEGTWADNAGRALELRIEGTGMLRARIRDGRAFTDLGTASVATTDRLRLRLRKGLGDASDLFVDSWNGSGWNLADASFPIADDSLLYLGRGVRVAQYDGGRRPVVRFTGSPLFPALDFELVRNFDALADWKIFQRGPAETSDIPLPVAWTSTQGVTLEARVVLAGSATPLAGFDWGDLQIPLDAAPAGAFARFDLVDVPTGGNYDVEARIVATDGSTQILGEDRIENVAVGDVFLAAGQSNMVGTSGGLAPTEPPDDLVHLFAPDYRWKRGSEPMDSSVQQVDLVSRDGNPQHSLMLRFAKEIRAATGVPIGIVPAPLGGTNLFNQWQRDDTYPANRATLYGSSIHRVNAQAFEHPIRGVIWYQGESDVGRGTALYLQDLENLVADYRSDLGNPDLHFGNCQLATNLLADIDGWVEIQEAQRQQAENDPDSVLVALVDLPRSDTIHLNVAGYKEAGVRLARAVLDGSYGISQNLGPQLLSIAREAGSQNRIVLTYDEPVTGGATVLYEVVRASNGNTIGVKTVTASGNEVTVEVQGNPSGELIVSYGFGFEPTDGWVVAADGSGAALAFDSLSVAP